MDVNIWIQTICTTIDNSNILGRNKSTKYNKSFVLEIKIKRSTKNVVSALT